MASLGADLAAIRKKQGLSVDDIRESTKLSENTIKSIEDDSVFENLARDKAFVRSYVRSYAKALNIDEAEIVNALDLVEKGDYEGNIKKDYL
ncbi:MAG TPA: helix-turn-helix transcriptional regulator, partial [Balneolaceae bacterium]|nr:helix-turn-helix transcriptional regulator [Balneolaceae bacterium]